MIGQLPKSLPINGKEVPIQTDYRIALLILQAFNDPELSAQEMAYVMIDALIGVDALKTDELEEAVKACVWFLDGGKNYSKDNSPRLMDWEQDEQMIFSAINKVAGQETRNAEYIHWWTFLGYFNEIQEGLFSSVLMIRQKKAKNKKLDKSEQEFYRSHKELIDLKQKYSKEEQEEIDRLNQLYQ